MGYAMSQGELLRKEFCSFTELDFSGFELKGVGGGFKRKFTWEPPDGIRVTQLQIYAVLDGRGYTATATTASAQFDTLVMVLLDTLYSLGVNRSEL